MEWTPSRLIDWAANVGPATAELVRIILESKPHPEMGYRACLGIMGLAKTYTAVRLEAASQRALLLHAHSYQSLKSILKRSLDRQTELELEVEKRARTTTTFAAPRITIRRLVRCCSKAITPTRRSTC